MAVVCERMEGAVVERFDYGGGGTHDPNLHSILQYGRGTPKLIATRPSHSKGHAERRKDARLSASMSANVTSYLAGAFSSVSYKYSRILSNPD